MESTTYWHAEKFTDDPEIQNDAAMVIKCRVADMNRPVARATRAIIAEHDIFAGADTRLMAFLDVVTYHTADDIGPATDDSELAAAAKIITAAGYAPISPKTILKHSPTYFRTQCVDKAVVSRMNLFKLYKDHDIVIDCESEYDFEAYQFIALQLYNEIPGRGHGHSYYRPLRSAVYDSTTCGVDSDHEISRLLRAADVFVNLLLWDDLADMIYVMVGQDDGDALAAVTASLGRGAAKRGVGIEEFTPPVVSGAIDALRRGIKFLNAA